MSQCVPNWDLDDAVRSRSRLHLRPHPSTSNSSGPDVPMLDYEMAELTWENGQLSMHGLGRSKPNLASSNKGLKYAWERPRAAAGTLESIVNLATQKPPPPLVRCFGTRPQPPGAKGTMDALVPCEEERRGPDRISTRGAGCSTRVDSCSGAAAATCEPTRDGDGDEGSVLKKPRSAPRVPAAAREASVSTMGADSWHVPTVDTCEKELMGGFGLTSTSFCSQGNTLSSSGRPATTNNDDHDSVCHSRPQRETRKDEEKKRIAKSSSSKRRSRAAAIHNQSERKRRDKINQKMKMLQKLVPNSNKTDKASMLDEVIDYLKQLQAQVRMMSQMSVPLMMMPQLAMQQQQQQLQMSMMAAAAAAVAPMGMGMGMGMGMPSPMAMDMNINMNPMSRQNLAAFMPVAAAWDVPYRLPSQVATAVVPTDSISTYIACQPQPMTVEAYSRMIALIQQQQQQLASVSKH